LVNRIKIPVLCLISKFETEMEYLSLNSSVFTYPLEHIKNVEYLNSRIRSLFFLGANGPMEQASSSMAEAAYKKNDPSDKRYLSRYVLELDQKVEILSKIKNKITGLSGLADNPVRNELLSIVNAIKRSLSNKDLWEDFKLFYQEADPDFLLLLARKYPFLTAVDLKYCCYLKMNMTNDDIRKIFGISLESVRTHKHRLKKKMALSKEQDLLSFLRSIN
jgi:DNA-binding CsgD family transcriptional regulator